MAQSVFRSEAGRAAILAPYDAAIANWPVPCETLLIDTEFGSTFVIACGDAPNEPVVLLHGSGTNSAFWMGDVARISADHRVYAIDIIGEPGRSAESRPTMRIAGNYARWLGEVLDGLNAPAAAVVGNSLGGWVALDFATAFPERVKKLVLLAPAGIAPARVSFMLSALLLKPLGRHGLGRLNRMVFGDAPIAESVLDYMNLIARQFRHRTEPMHVFSDDELRRLTMPILYVGGNRDVLLDTRKSASRLRSLLPNAQTSILPGVHHALVDQSARVSEFLKQ